MEVVVIRLLPILFLDAWARNVNVVKRYQEYYMLNITLKDYEDKCTIRLAVKAIYFIWYAIKTVYARDSDSSKVFALAEGWKSGLKSYSLLFLNPLCKPGPLCRLISSNLMLKSPNSKQILPNIFQSCFAAVFNFGKVKGQIGEPSPKYESETRGLQIVQNMQNI